jgi:hypothetical protein
MTDDFGRAAAFGGKRLRLKPNIWFRLKADVINSNKFKVPIKISRSMIGKNLASIQRYSQ